MFAVEVFRSDDPRMAGVIYIRDVVFCQEQAIPAEWEWDDLDPECDHFLLSHKTSPVGTVRIRPYEGVMKIERVAVLKAWRGHGAGRAVMEAVMAHVRSTGVKTAMLLHAQVAVEGFYQSLGFVSEGAHFQEDGIPHVRMCWRETPAA